jgi:hypothetical protein
MKEKLTKEQVIGTIEELKDVISILELQVRIQELHTQNATLHAKELEANVYINKITSPKDIIEDYVLTQEDIDKHPQLVKDGYAVGDKISSKKELKKNVSK